MTSGECVEIIGLMLGLAGVLLFSWGEIASTAAQLALRLRLDSDKSHLARYRQLPWHRRIPLVLAARLASRDSSAGETFLEEDPPPKFWGLVLIGLGFFAQVAVLLGLR
jgi:hypothetical protein